jgi:nucleoporin p58/p45
LFGSTAQKPAGGLFGSTTQPATQTSSLFGQQPQQQQQTSSLFGNNAATGTQQQGTSSLFGQQSTAQPGGLFGQSNQAGQQSSLFGSTLGQPQQQQQQQQQNLGQSQVTQLGSSLLGQPKQEVDIGTRIQNVKNAWDTNHPDCRLKVSNCDG